MKRKSAYYVINAVYLCNNNTWLNIQIKTFFVTGSGSLQEHWHFIAYEEVHGFLLYSVILVWMCEIDDASNFLCLFYVSFVFLGNVVIVNN